MTASACQTTLPVFRLLTPPKVNPQNIKGFGWVVRDKTRKVSKQQLVRYGKQGQGVLTPN